MTNVNLNSKLSIENHNSNHFSSILSFQDSSEINIKASKYFSQPVYSSLTDDIYDPAVIKNWSQYIFDIGTESRTFHCSFIYNDYLYILGGFDISKGKINSFVRLNLTTKSSNWEQVESFGDKPSIVSNSRCVLIDDKLYLYGGFNESNHPVNDFYELSLNNFSWIRLKNYLGDDKNLTQLSQKGKKTNLSIKQPNDDSHLNLPQLTGHIILYSKKQNAIILHGGSNKGEINTNTYIYLLNKSRWEVLISNDANSSRNLHGGDITEDDIIIITGGSDSEGKLYKDNYSLNLNIENPKWTKLEIETSLNNHLLERTGHSICYYKKNIFYIFGGKTGNMLEMNDLIKLTLKPDNKLIIELIHPCLLETYQNVMSHQNSFVSMSIDRLKSKRMTKEAERKLIKKKDKKKVDKEEIAKLKVFDEFLFESPDCKYMANSLIFKADAHDTKSLTNQSKLLTLKTEQLKINSQGLVPTQRDGQSMNIYNNKLIVFGGDRNKYSYNDLFLYSLEEEVKESSPYFKN